MHLEVLRSEIFPHYKTYPKVGTHMHTHTHTHTQTHTHSHTHTHIHTHTYTHSHTHTHINTYTRTRAHIHTHIHTGCCVSGISPESAVDRHSGVSPDWATAQAHVTNFGTDVLHGEAIQFVASHKNSFFLQILVEPRTRYS